MTDAILIERKDALLDITLNTPENGNLISNESGAVVVAALASLDPAVKLVRLLAKGPDFCRGRISPLPPKGARVTGHRIKAVVADPPLRLYEAFQAAPVPVLAVIAGRAIGVGCALAACCDLAIAADDAAFQVPEMAHDIPPLLVMTALIHQLPPKAIAHLVLSTDIISAAQAREWGIVSQVVPPAALTTAADALTARLLGYSLLSLRTIKEYLRSAKEMTQSGASRFAGNLMGTALSARFAE